MSDESATWEVVAGAWERHRDALFASSRWISEWLLDAAGVAPGQTILEVAAGTGETAFLAAERVGSQGRVIASDFSPGMVEAARRGAAARGLPNVECRVLDAEAIDLPDDSVDGVISRYGLMLVPDQPRAFAEIRRVLRPGGQLAYAVWGAANQNLWIVLLGLPMIQLGHLERIDPTAPGGMFSLSEPEQNETLLRDAGFADVAVATLDGTMRFESFDDYWVMQSQIAGSLAVALRALPPTEVAAVRTAVREAVEPFRDGDGYEFATRSTVARAS